MAWAIFTHGDQVLSLVFRMLEHDRVGEGNPPFSEWAKQFLANNIDWGSEPFRRDYVHGITIRVHEELQKDEASGLA